ncbi:hypothetical protein [Nocardia cyriacigeorgica]|uniref:hypothetical protein n=1 Tax=Nocardia cyriacigeorgica TaxID=135487 RepID=UPI002458C27B|nr:hypothetical protein [Nocardia cyriacigeorgica]
MTIYRRVAAETPDEVADCADCGAAEGMTHVFDLIDTLDRKCGEVWACTECGAENIDEW